MARIGEKLRERAQVLGLSDTEVARRVGLSQSRYANYVLGKREPDFGTLVKICFVLGTSPNYLIGFGEELEDKSVSGQLRREIRETLISMGEDALRTTLSVTAALVASQNQRLAILTEETVLPVSCEYNPTKGIHRTLPEGEAEETLFRLWMGPRRKRFADLGAVASASDLRSERPDIAEIFEEWKLGLTVFKEQRERFWVMDWHSGAPVAADREIVKIEQGGGAYWVEVDSRKTVTGRWHIVNDTMIVIRVDDVSARKDIYIAFHPEDGEKYAMEEMADAAPSYFRIRPMSVLMCDDDAEEDFSSSFRMIEDFKKGVRG
ncbi:MAG: helix-turn-helix transcriptional regulator [Phaeospirillum sp.]|nr:helix-turn-helix transcriptional regulator [Phaeospirillum sp.]